MQVVILAGGLGTRLLPLTKTFPKPMAPIKGKPFLEYQLELLKKNHLCDVILCIGYLGEQIETYFGDGKKIGMNISYSKEASPLGTGGALVNAKHLLEKEFFLLNGDTFLDIDYQDIVAHFHKANKIAMMVVFKNQPKVVQHNNIETNDKNQVLYYNKKLDGQANGVDAGVQIFRKDIFNLVHTPTPFSLEETLFGILIEKKELMAYPTDQMFYDIGTLERLKNFNTILLP